MKIKILLLTLLLAVTAFGQNTYRGKFVGDGTQLQLPGVVVTNTYNLRAYGAYGDAATCYGALALSNSTTFTVTGGAFVAGDVGKFIDIKGADINRRDWWTAITAVNSATNITVASAVPVSYNLALPGNVAAMSSGYPIIYGAHDDSAAMQAWLNQNTNGGGKFYAPPGVYLILNPPTNTINSQIQVPMSPWAAGNCGQFCEIYGSIGSYPQYGSASPRVSYDPNTTVFVTDIGTAANPGQWLQGMPSSFLDFRTAVAPQYGLALGLVPITSSGFIITNTLTPAYIHNLIVQPSYDANAIIIDLLGAQESRYQDLFVGTPFFPTYCPDPVATNGFGIVMPCNFSGTAGECRNSYVFGMHNGIDLGLMRGDYIGIFCCHNGFTALFTGGCGNVPISNVQFSDTPIWLLGSGDTNYYSALGNAAETVSPRISVLTYETSVVGESNPDWQTNAPYAIYDPTNSFCEAGNAEPSGYIRFPQAQGAGASAITFQGPIFNRVIFAQVEEDIANQGALIDPQPKVFGGAVTTTNGLSVTGVMPTVINSGSGAYWERFQIQQNGDVVGMKYIADATRHITWVTGIDDRYSLGGNTNSMFWMAYGGPVAGFGGYEVMMLDPLGDLTTLGTVTASNYVGNGSGLTNIWYPTNFAKPTIPTGSSGVWVSNGWMYYLTTQHPNGVLITAP
jgi:hypothetical protein